MAIRWSQDAPNQLSSIWEYIAEDNPEAARLTVERILEAIDQLAGFPQSGRRGRVPDTRELIVPPYLIVYRAQPDAVTIEAVLHGGRRY